MRLHTHTINDTPRGDGPLWRAGRFYVSAYDGPVNRETEVLDVHAEWYLWSPGGSMGVALKADDDLTLGVRLGRLAAVWLTVERLPLVGWVARRWCTDPRELSVSVHDGLIAWHLWIDPHSWTRGQRRTGSWSWKRWIQGKPEHSHEVLEEHTTIVPMPEANYPAVVKLTRSTWRFPRWPTKVVYGADIEPGTPIPVPGKGENSWDCGDDAIHSMSCGAKSVHEAIGQMVASAMRDRLRYGGSAFMESAS